jgi:hypothetical protein
MKNNKHVENFGEFNENLNISDVRSSKMRNTKKANLFKKRLPKNLFSWGTVEFCLSEDEFSWRPIVKKNKPEYEQEFYDAGVYGGLDSQTLLDFPDVITKEMIDDFLKNGNFEISLCPCQDPHDFMYLQNKNGKYFLGGSFGYQNGITDEYDENLPDTSNPEFEIELTQSEYNLANEMLKKLLNKHGYIS